MRSETFWKKSRARKVQKPRALLKQHPAELLSKMYSGFFEKNITKASNVV